MGELTMPSRKRNSSGPDLSWLHFYRTAASSPLSDHSSSSESTEKLNSSTGLQSSSVRQTKTMHVATVFTDGGPRTLRSLTVSLGPVSKTEGFPKDSKIATTSASVHLSPSAVESRRNSRVTGNPGDGEFIEPSTENEFGLTSLHWQNDSPTFGEHQLASSSEVQNGSPMSQTETVSRSVAPTRGRVSTEHWLLTNSTTSADVTGSSASYPEGVNASVLTQISDSTVQSGGSHTALGDRNYSESSSTSSSESLNSSAPRGERSTGSLCKRKSPECDKDTSICTDLDGVALCQCKSGYFQFNKMDHSCRACEDGYRLENETCMSCPFGLGGLNCGNPYQLITVVIAAAGGGLLLILGIALIVTCCRKNKNDISKLIFKSGDFQMSPYAEYPKNPRSQEWGREAIEMHENGSTKNLLQMTDVYYSPTSVRNPELERNGLYPAYTGLPGSRHSCIFPGQYNPSFISDESRRRDYF
ncbi:hypothetical protein H8959_020443 [Pygathrix nigripes]